MIGSLASTAVATSDRPAAFAAIRSVSQMPDISYARLESRTGLLAETGGGARLVRDARISGDDGISVWSVFTTGSIEVTSPVMDQGQVVGSITLFSRTPELRSRVLATALTSLAGALVAVVAGLLVASRMARQISRPVVELATLVRRVHETHDYAATARIEAEGEVADLVEGFDAMMAGIRDRDARIAAHVTSLESQVESRTADLVVARDAADQANAAKSDFLAVMSHEIRTPLNGILALSEMLAKSDLPQRQQRYATVIAKSGHSLLSIINDILDFSKVEAGKMELESVEVDLVEVAEDVASLFSEKAASKGLDLAVFVDPQIGRVLADPVRLRQVIGNLVNNAIKFTETGGVLIAIRLEDGGVRVSVEDTGPGIPEDRLPLLFEAFSQADQSTSRKYGGTGLGLAICDRLVRSMGGLWQLSSVVGQGSVFAFTAPLPVVPGSADVPDFRPGWTVQLAGLGPQTTRAVSAYLDGFRIAAGAETASGAIVGPAEACRLPHVVVCRTEEEAAGVLARDPGASTVVLPLRRVDLIALLLQIQDGRTPRLENAVAQTPEGLTFPGARVLVVDDSEVNREVATEALARLGVEVETAVDGFEAVAALRAKTFDLVLMDGSMPGLDGFEATRRIRAEEAGTGGRRAVIIALTAHVVGSGADAWKACGMDGVIHKPFTLADLVRELGRHCAEFARKGLALPVNAGTAMDAEQDDDLFDPVVRGDLLSMAQTGRLEFVQRVQSLYAENAPLRVTEAFEAASDGDQDAVARAAHALKSMSLSLGAAAVARDASTLETAARGGAATAPAVLEALSERVRLTIERMTADLAPDARPTHAPTIVEQFRAALAGGHLHVAYQPLVDRTGAPAGKVEALVRWTDPHLGRLSPDVFIPALEAASAIELVTDFVLETALREMADRQVTVSINASAAEFRKPDFVDRIVAAVSAANYPPSRLEIEVTETAMLDVEAAGRTIDALRALGFGVALDDFGAGFTSLHALRALRFTTLKIDRSFVDRCHEETASAAIIHAVIGVGRALGMKIVCEGVETEQQAAFLRVAGVHYMQGFYFHRPVSAGDLQPQDLKAA